MRARPTYNLVEFLNFVVLLHISVSMALISMFAEPTVARTCRLVWHDIDMVLFHEKLSVLEVAD